MGSPLQPRILPKFPQSNISFPFLDHYLNANRLADFRAFNSLPEEIKTKQQESFRFVESTFPFYLSEKQHKMSFSVPETSKGEYWGDAAHFLLSNKAHGFPLWSEFEKQIRSMDAKISSMPHISTSMTNFILKHKLDHQLDQAEGEWFAVSSFVLAQLPFQPVLLYQWLTQSLFHLSNFELHMRDFYAIPVPAKFKPHLMCLHRLLKTTQRNIGFLFDYLQYQVESEPDIYVGNLKVFEIILNKILTFLKFWNDENYLYIHNLRVKCWEHWDPDAGLFQLMRGSMTFKKRNFLFNLDFWRGPSKNLKLFGNSNEHLVRGRQDLPDDVTWKKTLNDWNIDIECFVKKITKNAGKKRHTFDYLLENDAEFKERMKKVKRWSSGLAVEISDRGIIGHVLNLNTIIELKIAIAEALFYLTKKYRESPVIFIPNISLTYVDIDVDKIESLVKTVKADYYHDLFDFKSLPVFAVDKAKEIDLLDIQNTTNRCLNIVIQCMRGLNTENYEKKKDYVMRDWQVAQILLPCFISLYSVILKSAQNDLRNWYSKFLDKLLGTYEDKKVGVRKSSWANILNDIQNNSDLLSENSHEELLKFFDRVLNKFIDKVKTCPTAFGHLAHCGYFKTFYEVLERNHGKNKKSSVQSNDIATKPSIYWNWLMWDFFDRMKQAMNTEEKKQDSVVI